MSDEQEEADPAILEAIEEVEKNPPKGLEQPNKSKALGPRVKRAYGSAGGVQPKKGVWTNKHYKILTLYFDDGWKCKDVAEVVGCSQATVRKVINDPNAQHIAEMYKDMEKSRLRAGSYKAIDRLVELLDHHDPNIVLKASEKLLAWTKHHEGRDEGAQVNVQVNMDARERLVERIKNTQEVKQMYEIEG